MNKTINQKAWLFVIPVFILVAFNAVVPLMTVVNYAFQETFGNNVFTWEGTRWFKQILRSERFHAALGRQFLFTWNNTCHTNSSWHSDCFNNAKKRYWSSSLFSIDVYAFVNSMERSRGNVEYFCSA